MFEVEGEFRGPDGPRYMSEVTGRKRLMRGGANESVFLNPIANLIAVHAEQRRRACLIAAAALERLDDEAPLERLEVHALRWQIK